MCIENAVDSCGLHLVIGTPVTRLIREGPALAVIALSGVALPCGDKACMRAVMPSQTPPMLGDLLFGPAMRASHVDIELQRTESNR